MNSSPLQPDLKWGPVLAGLLGLVVCVVVSFTPENLPEGLSPEGLRTLGCAWLMAWWWIGSGLPLAVPSLVPLAAFPILNLDSKAVAAPYADRMSSFSSAAFAALAVEKWKLHERIALHVLLRWRPPAGLVAGVMAITAVLSMWISTPPPP